MRASLLAMATITLLRGARLTTSNFVAAVIAAIQYNRAVHPLVEQIDELFLPELERLASDLQQRYPNLGFNVWHGVVGSLTDYQGYDCGVECLFPKVRLLGCRLPHEAVDCLLQLRINFIGDGHNIVQQHTEIHGAQVLLQCIEDADL